MLCTFTAISQLLNSVSNPNVVQIWSPAFPKKTEVKLKESPRIPFTNNNWMVPITSGCKIIVLIVHWWCCGPVCPRCGPYGCFSPDCRNIDSRRATGTSLDWDNHRSQIHFASVWCPKVRHINYANCWSNTPSNGNMHNAVIGLATVPNFTHSQAIPIHSREKHVKKSYHTCRKVCFSFWCL